jgi:archaellum component FlaC
MKDITTELKGSLGQIKDMSQNFDNNLLDIMERITDLDTRLHMIEKKLSFIVLPDFRTEDKDEGEWLFEGGSYGGTD